MRGSLVGNVTSYRVATPVIVSANNHISKLVISGRVERTQILSGYDTNLSPQSGDAQVGPVTVGGDWIDSSIDARVQNSNGEPFLGEGNDSIFGGLANSAAKIASITIWGIVAGSGNASEHFGLVSHFIGPFKAVEFTLAPTIVGSPTFFLAPTTEDVTVEAV